MLFGRAAIHLRDTSLPAAAFKTLHPSGRSGLALSLLTAPAPPGPSVPKRAQERRLGTSRPTVPTHAGGRARRDATREERSETGVTRDGERALPAAGPSEVLSHGRGYSRHIRSLLTLEKQQSVRQSADPRAGRGAGERLLGEGTLPPSWGGKKEGHGSSRKGEGAAPCVWSRQLCADCLQDRCSWRGGAELRAILQNPND